MAHHLAQSHQCDASTTIVGGVLTQGQFAIQLKVVHGDEVAVFVGDTTGAGFKFLGILLRPPVAQITLRIEFASLVIEAVGEFVSDHGADATKVDSVIHLLVEERRLQDTCGEHDLIA